MKSENTFRRNFSSDNCSGICPEAWAALHEANHGHVTGYGNDPYTAKATNLFREIFETDCDVYFVFNGTASNSLALAALCQSYHGVICHEMAHIETSECGAPEFFSNGAKLIYAQGANGKLDPASVETQADQRSNIHFCKARALSLTQGTETGLTYKPAELSSLTDVAKKYDLSVHMDGARFANAVSSLKLAPKEITWKVGIDVLSMGGTKNGMAVGEAIVFFNRDLARDFEYRCKQSGQLASKMRFLAAPWLGMLQDGAWLRHAGHANAMARLMGERLQQIGISLAYPCENNTAFARLPQNVITALYERGWNFNTHVSPGDSRLVCSWDTTPEDVNAFVNDVKTLLVPA